MKICIVGIGLIGGSIAIALRKKGMASQLIGVENNASHAETALELKLVDAILPIDEAIKNCQLIIISIPVSSTAELLPSVLDKVTDQTVMDVGSAKHKICEAVRGHRNRKNFVATHPMWGTERSGPESAIEGAFVNKAAVICNKSDSNEKSIQLVERVYEVLGMHILYMDAAVHDIHTAYISHVSHITSFALANTVLEKEKEDETIFELASGGFESTVRLAKSNPDMWLPIFIQNKENVLDVLNEHIVQLRKFKSALEKENFSYLYELMQHANTIKRILK